MPEIRSASSRQLYRRINKHITSSSSAAAVELRRLWSIPWTGICWCLCQFDVQQVYVTVQIPYCASGIRYVQLPRNWSICCRYHLVCHASFSSLDILANYRRTLEVHHVVHLDKTNRILISCISVTYLCVHVPMSIERKYLWVICLPSTDAHVVTVFHLAPVEKTVFRKVPAFSSQRSSHCLEIRWSAYPILRPWVVHTLEQLVQDK